MCTGPWFLDLGCTLYRTKRAHDHDRDCVQVYERANQCEWRAGRAGKGWLAGDVALAREPITREVVCPGTTFPSTPSFRIPVHFSSCPYRRYRDFGPCSRLHESKTRGYICFVTFSIAENTVGSCYGLRALLAGDAVSSEPKTEAGCGFLCTEMEQVCNVPCETRRYKKEVDDDGMKQVTV